MYELEVEVKCRFDLPNLMRQRSVELVIGTCCRRWASCYDDIIYSCMIAHFHFEMLLRLSTSALGPGFRFLSLLQHPAPAVKFVGRHYATETGPRAACIAIAAVLMSGILALPSDLQLRILALLPFDQRSDSSTQLQ